MSDQKGKIFVDVIDVAEKQLDSNIGLDYVTKGKNGAETLFVGTVRNLNFGRDVVGISYDVFEPLAKQSFLEICQEAQEKWGANLDCYIVHAKGRLEVGGVSIVLAVGSPHRDEAFKALRYMIEEVKHRSPIWKLEHFVDGDSEWSKGCELCPKNHMQTNERHEDHTI